MVGADATEADRSEGFVSPLRGRAPKHWILRSDPPYTPTPSHSGTLFVVTLAATWSTLYQSDSWVFWCGGCLRYLNLASVLPALCVEKQPWHRQEAEHCSGKQDELQDVFFFSFKEVLHSPRRKYESFKVYTIFWTFQCFTLQSDRPFLWHDIPSTFQRAAWCLRP